MRKEYRELKKIVSREGGKVLTIEKRDRMEKVTIVLNGKKIVYNFSTSKHCNFQKIVKSQIRNIKKKVS